VRGEYALVVRLLLLFSRVPKIWSDLLPQFLAVLFVRPLKLLGTYLRSSLFCDVFGRQSRSGFLTVVI